jgi:hypothetical protein
MLRTGTFAVAALGSLGAGAIHAAAIGAHGEHHEAVVTFAFVALFQIGLGAVALVSNRKLVGLALGLGNLALVGGWVLAKTATNGIWFVTGLDSKEPVQWADGLAAGLAMMAVVGVAIAALNRWRMPIGEALTRVLALPVVVLTLTGMIAAGSHQHSHDATAAGHVHGGAATAAAVPPTPFVPGQPIDLGGVAGVTAAQQAQAENILAATVYTLPKFSDPVQDETLGFHSIGDSVTGDEHYINLDNINDDKVLDPSYPESLVFEMRNGKKTLVAAMFMALPGTTLANTPNVGGALMQWHIHDNLCFTPNGRVGGLRAPGTECTNGLVKGGETPMIHVWIVSHPCGPFAALEGIGGGTIAQGATRLCDHVHGH